MKFLFRLNIYYAGSFYPGHNPYNLLMSVVEFFLQSQIWAYAGAKTFLRTIMKHWSLKMVELFFCLVTLK